jgi:hypothetical protein
MFAPGAMSSPVIIVDDGELADVRELLARLDVEYAEETCLESAAEDASCGLLITSARRSVAPGCGGARPRCKLYVVVYDGMSRTVRRVIAQSGCDVVIGRPVHPAVFQLLVAHALYAGPERRSLGRVAMEAPVMLRVGRRPREATIVQLSLRGCGLVSSQDMETGQGVEVIFPPGLTNGAALPLAGRVLAVGAFSANAGRSHDIAVGFRSSHAAVRQVLQGVMDRHSLGTTTALAPPPAEVPEAAAIVPDGGGERSVSDADRRAGPRKLFARRVLAAAAGGTQVLIGRDLSAGGMRVRPVPGLQVGDEFKLALYGNGEHSALVLEAVVIRDDGWDGLVLHFRDVGASAAAELERLVKSLPAARAAKRAGERAPGVVVSEIIERR